MLLFHSFVDNLINCESIFALSRIIIQFDMDWINKSNPQRPWKGVIVMSSFRILSLFRSIYFIYFAIDFFNFMIIIE